MIKKISIFLIISLTALSKCYAVNLNCDNFIVQIGDTTYDILMKCEKPGWVDKTEVDIIKQINSNEWKIIQVKREVWLYNWGPNTFMKELIIENDRLIEIKSLDYGYLEKDIGSFGNEENKLYIQMSKSEVLIHWGEPTYKTSRTEEKFYKIDDNYKKYNVTITEWIYNFGPKRFMKTLIFENDRLVSIVRENYGYNKKSPNK